jgi:CheY-like chemotaxis protein
MRDIAPVIRLLCADDEPDIRTILELALSLEPTIEAEIFDSGTALIARAQAGGADAILLDAMMPGVDGYETCRRLKADPRTKDLPVIFLTAKAQRGELDGAIEVGALACLTKPFDPLTLAGELLDVLRP